MSALERYKLNSNVLDLCFFRVMSADIIAKASSKFGAETVSGATSSNDNLARDQDAALPNAVTSLSSPKFTSLTSTSLLY
jgi:lysophospholipid acyltransferase (LPLAT)-like uncharacterized protein